MKFFEDILEKLDNYFNTKKNNEKNIIIFGVGILIFVFAYYLLLPITEDRFNRTENEKKQVEKILNEQKDYMNSISVNGDKDYYVKQYTQELKQIKQSIADLTLKTNLINESMKKLSDMIFNEKSWSNFLNSITGKAEDNNIDILKINNRKIESNSTSFGHVLEIQIQCQGEYKDILKFINELEQTKLVTDVYGSKIKINKKRTATVADLNVSVWGVNN
ncbi:MAG: type 4a pilus biogenesis protein PilO [Sulfurovaceae bacterium]|nr:type 4a pilus biogenesis protein PilO [Sulfurovaceae bacterium]